MKNWQFREVKKFAESQAAGNWQAGVQPRYLFSLLLCVPHKGTPSTAVYKVFSVALRWFQGVRKTVSVIVQILHETKITNVVES